MPDEIREALLTKRIVGAEHSGLSGESVLHLEDGRRIAVTAMSGPFVGYCWCDDREYADFQRLLRDS